MWRQYRSHPFSVSLEFRDDGFTAVESVKEGSKKRDCAYSEIKAVYESGTLVLLFMASDKCHIVRKADFRDGSPESFADFAAGRAGVAKQRI